jgi:type I restriction-modification system DNA methylase subunit
VFLRIAEDRGIEKYSQLQGYLNGANIYARLCKLFYQNESKYNSGLFDFQKDSFITSLKIDDKILKEIIEDLYYPKSPYRFSVLGADILGNIYEQFLGKVIRLTAGHQAKVEEKPEVKKAGGVYYTPKYIVDYIVKNTVGKLVENVGAQLAVPLKPDQISKLKILDPACGSGSFLLGAYQYLLEYHLNWYVDHRAEIKKINDFIYQGKAGQWFLTTREKKNILLHNIFGVDIDPQAVEVTKLSLLLKVLENESEESIKKQLQLFHERALPDLDSNIKCGNSLIGSDFYKNQQINLFDDEQKYKINAFDWETEFPEIFKKGGFDLIIGNPPYIGFQGFKEDKNYLKEKYSTAEGLFDFYIPFLEKSIHLLIVKGLLGFICPTNFMKRNHGKKIRSLLLEKTQIMEINDFEDKQIFQGATNYTGIFIFQVSEPKKEHCLAYRKSSLNAESIEVLQSALNEDVWVFRDSNSESIVNKIVKNKSVSSLETICEGISEGIVTGENSVFLLNDITANSIGLEDGIAYPSHLSKITFSEH